LWVLYRRPGKEGRHSGLASTGFGGSRRTFNSFYQERFRSRAKTKESTGPAGAAKKVSDTQTRKGDGSQRDLLTKKNEKGKRGGDGQLREKEE